MYQVMAPNPGKRSDQQDTEERRDQRAETPQSFNDLVIDHSLTPVRVSVVTTRTIEQAPWTEDDLLIELQCEV